MRLGRSVLNFVRSSTSRRTGSRCWVRAWTSACALRLSRGHTRMNASASSPDAGRLHAIRKQGSARDVQAILACRSSVAARHESIARDRGFADSLQERRGFELPVPLAGTSFHFANERSVGELGRSTGHPFFEGNQRFESPLLQRGVSSEPCRGDQKGVWPDPIKVRYRELLGRSSPIFSRNVVPSCSAETDRATVVLGSRAQASVRW